MGRLVKGTTHWQRNGKSGLKHELEPNKCTRWHRPYLHWYHCVPRTRTNPHSRTHIPVDHWWITLATLFIFSYSFSLSLSFPFPSSCLPFTLLSCSNYPLRTQSRNSATRSSVTAFFVIWTNVRCRISGVTQINVKFSIQVLIINGMIISE